MLTAHLLQTPTEEVSFLLCEKCAVLIDLLGIAFGDVADMTGVETRSDSRDSLFLLANVKVEQATDQHRVRVRNLSDGGMMGEGVLSVRRGNRVEIELRNIGVVGGNVAWVQDQRFGIAFDEEVDSQLARQPAKDGVAEPLLATSTSYAHRAPPPPPPRNLRKV